MYPFWSPDSRSIGFFAQGKLKRVWISGGPPQTVCDTFGGEGTWSQHGVILFGFADAGGPCLYRVPATGGVPVPVTAMDKSRHEDSHGSPHFLPDGRHFLYFVRSPQSETQEIYVGSLDSPLKMRVLGARHRACYVAPGYLLIGQANEVGGQGTLMAYPFDLNRLEIAGEPIPIVEQVMKTFTSYFAASGNLLVYRQGRIKTQLAWFDRSGKKLSAIDDPNAWHPALAPNERRVAVQRAEPQTRNIDIWLADSTGTRFFRLTLNPALDGFAVWSPDGSRVLFTSNRKGSLDLYQKLADGTGLEVPVLESSLLKYPWDWSSDGQFICYAEQKAKPRNDFDLWILPLSGNRRPIPLLETEFNEFEGQFSPEAKGPPRWIAYTSTESGRDEVYVTGFPGQKGGGRKWAISRDGRGDPRWRRDGRELFYVNANH
jgi:eukaryotic-like serine/threonine-protein kinase